MKTVNPIPIMTETMNKGINMCTIWVKESGYPMPDNWEEMVTNLVDANAHGNGLMYTDGDDMVHAVKGIMDEKSLIEEIKKINNVEDRHLMVHARIATHGTKDELMTHPFPISRKIEDMKLLKFKCKSALAHNGIMTNFGSVIDKDYSDSAHFAHFLSYMDLNELIPDKSPLMEYIESIIGGSKIVLFYKGYAFYFGKWVTDVSYQGCSFSNRDYEGKKYYASLYKKGKTVTAADHKWGYQNGWDENAMYRGGGTLFESPDTEDDDDIIVTPNDNHVQSVTGKQMFVCDNTAMCENFSCKHKLPHLPSIINNCYGKRNCDFNEFNMDSTCTSLYYHTAGYQDVECEGFSIPCIICGEYCDDDDYWEFEVPYQSVIKNKEGKVVYTEAGMKQLYMCHFCKNTRYNGKSMSEKEWFNVFESHFKGIQL